MSVTVRCVRLVAATAALQSLAAVLAVGATHGLRVSLDSLAGPGPSADPERVTAALCAVAWAGLLLCAGWLAAAVLACARDLARHPARPLPRGAQDCLRPAFVRSLLVVLVGGFLVTPRPSPVAEQDPGWEVLDGLPLPSLPEGGPTTARRAPHSDPRPATVRVRAGDCLWSITAGLLDPGSSDAEVARAWPRLHRANRALVGADPDLLHVGDVLRVPTSLTTPFTTARPGAAR